MADKINCDTVVSTAEIASVLGITPRRIQQYYQDGTIPTVGRGKAKLGEAVQGWAKRIAGEPADTDSINLEKAKLEAEVRLKKSKAHIAELEAAELQGKMHRSEDVEAITNDLIYSIRGSLMALPGRLAMDIAPEMTAAEAAEIIRKEVALLMQEMAQYRYDPAKYEERVRERMDWEVEKADGKEE